MCFMLALMDMYSYYNYSKNIRAPIEPLKVLHYSEPMDVALSCILIISTPVVLNCMYAVV